MSASICYGSGTVPSPLPRLTHWNAYVPVCQVLVTQMRHWGLKWLKCLPKVPHLVRRSAQIGTKPLNTSLLPGEGIQVLWGDKGNAWPEGVAQTCLLPEFPEVPRPRPSFSLLRPLWQGAHFLGCTPAGPEPPCSGSSEVWCLESCWCFLFWFQIKCTLAWVGLLFAFWHLGSACPDGNRSALQLKAVTDTYSWISFPPSKWISLQPEGQDHGWCAMVNVHETS